MCLYCRGDRVEQLKIQIVYVIFWFSKRCSTKPYLRQAYLQKQVALVSNAFAQQQFSYYSSEETPANLPTCAHCESFGTVIQQVCFEGAWHRLSKVVDFNSAWKQNNNQDVAAQMSHNHLTQEPVGPPVLFLMVIIDPPPSPMLCGLTTEVHSRAAMAPSTAEPPCWSMLLQESHFCWIYGNCEHTHTLTI